MFAVPLYWLPAAYFKTNISGKEFDSREVFMASFVSAHLILVFFRSHANPKIFWTHPLRFSVVPAVLLISMATSLWAFVLIGVLAVWWDVYHSSLQTFGFGRIYDAKQGNPSDVGRKLDIWINLALYAGPVLAGAQFAAHIQQCTTKFTFLNVSDNPLRELITQQAPDFLFHNQKYMTIAVLATGIPFLGYYLYSYYRLARGLSGLVAKSEPAVDHGMRLALRVGLSLVLRRLLDDELLSRPAVLRDRLLFRAEKSGRIFRVDRFALGSAVVLFWIVALTFAYGFWARYFVSGTWLKSAVLTIAIMHFWYDSFIWSVKKKQV